MPSVLIAGSGGQGILFFGKLIAQTAMREGRNVTWFPSYGAEMRGGTANCVVIVSEEVIGSPIVRDPDMLVVLNSASLEKFQSRLKPNGILILDSSLVKGQLRDDVRVLSVPATDIALSLGNPKSANMVLLGAVIAASGLVSEEGAMNALKELTPARRVKDLDANRAAIKKGMEHLR